MFSEVTPRKLFLKALQSGGPAWMYEAEISAPI